MIHQHSIPEVNFKVKRQTIRFTDKYQFMNTPSPQEDILVSIPGVPAVPSRVIQVATGQIKTIQVPGRYGRPGYKLQRAILKTITIPGVPAIPPRTHSIPQPDKINFSEKRVYRYAAVGGQNVNIRTRLTNRIQQVEGQYNAPTEIGHMTNNIERVSSSLLNKVTEQKITLDRIVTRANEFLSRNQFIN